MAPHAGEAVGLQFHQHRELIGLARRPLLQGADLPLDAQQVLHVVPDLVRDDVGLGEVAGRAEAPIQLVEELEIEIDLLIAGTVERAHGALAEATRRLGGAAEEHERRLLVATAEQSCPGRLQVVEHLPDLDHLGLFLGGRLQRSRLAGLLRRHLRLLLQDRRHHVAAQHETQDEQQHDAADAHRRPAPAHAHRAAIFDVTAPLPSGVPAQRPTPLLEGTSTVPM